MQRGLLTGAGILILLVAIGGFVYLHSSPKSSAQTSSPTGSVVTVTLTDNGFTPETLTIHQGQTVKFTSTQGSFFWPASNPHPTHTIYPEFDPQQPIAGTDSWSFTFERVGTWRYHDHLAPYFTGTITVLPSS